MKLVLLCLSLSTFLFSAEPLSRFERFVCDGGLKLINKTYVISYHEEESFHEAQEKMDQLHATLISIVDDPKNHFFNNFKLSIVLDHSIQRYLVVDTICQAQNLFNSEALVNSIMSKRLGMNPVILKVHTNRWDRPKRLRKDFLELIFEGDEYSFN